MVLALAGGAGTHFAFAEEATGHPRVVINFPFHSPEVASTGTFLEWLQDLGAPGMRQMAYNDVFWSHVESTDNNFVFTGADAAINNSHHVQAFPTLFSMMGSGPMEATGLQVPWRACSAGPGCGWFYERDAPATEHYVRTVVARYKTRVKYWEVANEMNGATSRPRGLPPPLFANFLVSNRAWIQMEDPEAKVVLPGLIGTYGFPFSNSTNWLSALLTAGGGAGFDVANFHDYNAWWTLPQHYDMVRGVLDAAGLQGIPIWVTETGISSRAYTPITPAYSSPDGQAADVWRRLALLYGKGASLVAWHSFFSVNGAPGADTWDQFGLLDHTGKKKKSWHSMKLLISRLEGFKKASLIAAGRATNSNLEGGEGTWVVRFACADGLTRHVMWSPDEQAYTLSGLAEGQQLSITKVVPSVISTDGHSATFDNQVITTTGGEHAFTLADTPILVEPVPPVKLNCDASTGVLSWPDAVVGSLLLETSTTLAPQSWSTVPSADVEQALIRGTRSARYIGPHTGRRFFRLRWTSP